MFNDPHHSQRRIAAASLVFAAVIAACGESDDSSAGAETSAPTDGTVGTDPPVTDPPATDPPVTDPPATEPPATDPPVTDPPATEPPASPDCPAPVAAPAIEPVEPDVEEFPAFDGSRNTVPAGRYTTAALGVSIAVDLPTDDFAIPFTAGGNIVATDNPGGVIAFLRASDFVVTAPTGDAGDGERLDFDEWLVASGVTVIADSDSTIAGLPARDVTVRVPAVADDDTAPFVEHWGLRAMPEVEQRILIVDIGDPEPLLITIQPSVPDDPAAAEQFELMLASLAVGAPGPSLATVYADSPWNVDNLFWFPPEPTPAGCVVPLVGFGGSEFELAETTRIRGAGDEIFLIDPDVPYVGITPPTIQLVAPEFAAVEAELLDSKNGTPVENIDDAIAEMTADGYELTPIDSEATVFGAPVTAFDFVGPEMPPDLWVPRSHTASAGNPNAVEEPFRSGTVYVAETDVGVIVAMVEGETGTDDASLMRERFDLMVVTLRRS